MAGHPDRRLARKIAALNRAGTPLRHGRGVVVSSTVGTSVVTIDGGVSPDNDITATNYGHAQQLPVGTVVDVLHVGRKTYILGAYTATEIVKWGNTVVTTNGSGIGTVSFTTAFPTACDAVVLQVAGTGAGPPAVYFLDSSSASGFTFTAKNAAGATINSAPEQIVYIAVGH